VACPQWHCRAWARAWSSPLPAARTLAAGAWQRLEALPDPCSPQGRIYPLACLIAIAACAFTAAGNDRFTAVGQWIKHASQADLARLLASWDPLVGRYRAPDEKTIRVVLDRLDPRALARALLGPCPRGTRRPGAVGGQHAAHHHVRDVTFGEDTSTGRTGRGPAILATIRAALKDAGYLHIPEGRRDHTTPAETLCLHGLD
jgi:hypothetical protein